MKYGILFLWSLLLTTCTKEGGENNEGFSTKEALLINQLAVDGCGWHFGVGLGDEYSQLAADTDSQEGLVDPFIQTIQSQGGVYSVKVEITYKLTEKKRDVLCGWGKKTSMTEIQLKGIKVL